MLAEIELAYIVLQFINAISCRPKFAPEEAVTQRGFLSRMRQLDTSSLLASVADRDERHNTLR